MFKSNLLVGLVVLIVFIGCFGCEQKSEISYTPANSTDHNWEKGIARNKPASFYIKGLNQQVKSDFVIGKKVILADGSVRRIINTKEHNGNLIVFLNGTQLYGNKVGYPNKLKITDETKESNVPHKLSDFTDKNWVNGIANNWGPAFYIKKLPETKEDFFIGRLVTFADGSTRKIVNTKEHSTNLIVFLDGTPLDGNKVGYPKEIMVSEPENVE